MTRQSDKQKAPQEEEDVLAPPVPPDGGWGWVVVIGSLFCNIIVDGVCFSFGIFYPEFLSYFRESRGKTAIVGSLIPGMYLGTGPLVSALANRFGIRPVTIVGSIIAAVSFFISTFSPSVDVLIFTYGIMGGLGFGLMYLPSIVIVGFYFDKRRALATGLAVCGSGIGTFLFAPFGRYLLDNFGWKGGYWIISAIILNGCVCGALFRPLTATAIKDKKPQELKDLPPNAEPPKSYIFDRIIDEKKRNRTISTGSLDGCVITKDNTLISDPEKIKNMKNLQQQHQQKAKGGLGRLEEVEDEGEDGVRKAPLLNTRLNQLKAEGRRVRPPAPLPEDAPAPRPPAPIPTGTMENLAGGHNPSEPLLDSDPKSLVSSTRSLSFFSTEAPMRLRTRSESRKTQYRVSRTGERVPLDNQNKMATKLSLSRVDLAKEIARPMNRKDIFYTGSVASLREYKMNPDMTSYIASQTSLRPMDTKESGGSCAPLCSVLREMLDFSLLKSPTFILLCTTSILAMTGFFTPFVYITDNALKLGVDPYNAALLLSVLGMCNTIGRILCGMVSDMPWADCLIIHNVALIIAGTATCFVPFLTSFPLLIGYCVIFGFCIAAFITLRSIVLVELLGLEKLTSSFGLLLLFQGIASLIGSPIAGAIFDTTQSYTLSFVVSGVLIAVSGFIALPVRRLAAWESIHIRPLGGEMTYTHIQPEDLETPT